MIATWSSLDCWCSVVGVVLRRGGCLIARIVLALSYCLR